MRSNPRFGAWVVALLGGLGLIVTWPSPGRADSPFAAVDARATADAFRLGVAVRKFLIVENFIDAGGPTAQAHLTPDDGRHSPEVQAAYLGKAVA